MNLLKLTFILLATSPSISYGTGCLGGYYAHIQNEYLKTSSIEIFENKEPRVIVRPYANGEKATLHLTDVAIDGERLYLVSQGFDVSVLNPELAAQQLKEQLDQLQVEVYENVYELTIYDDCYDIEPGQIIKNRSYHLQLNLSDKSHLIFRQVNHP